MINKINDIIKFIKKEIVLGNQIFWVCPLIEESKKIDHESAVKKFAYLEKIFPNQVSLLHGKTNIDQKEIILNVKILVDKKDRTCKSQSQNKLDKPFVVCFKYSTNIPQEF